MISLDDIDEDVADDFGFGRLKEKAISTLKWLWRKCFRDKTYMFTRDNIRVDRIEHYGNEVCAYIDVMFDTEKKFGLKLIDDEYVNVYAYISGGDVRVTYVIYYADGFIDDERSFDKLTPDEKKLIAELVNENSLTETGKPIASILEECGAATANAS